METTPNALGKKIKIIIEERKKRLREKVIEKVTDNTGEKSQLLRHSCKPRPKQRALLSSGQEALPVAAFGTKVLQSPPMDVLRVLEAVPPKDIIDSHISLCLSAHHMGVAVMVHSIIGAPTCVLRVHTKERADT